MFLIGGVAGQVPFLRMIMVHLQVSSLEPSIHKIFHMEYLSMPTNTHVTFLQMARILLLLVALVVLHTANAQTVNETDLVAGVNTTTLTMQRVPYNADILLNVSISY